MAKGFLTIPLRSAAWQTASISNALSNFEDTLMIDLAVVYEFVEAQEDYLQLTTSLNRSQLYSKETLLPYLKVNHDLLRGHIGNTIVTLEEIQDFLEKYGVLEVEGKHDE